MFEKIAFVGIGIMGQAMVVRLLAAGHPVFIFARRREAAIPLIERGARWCDTAAAAAAQADLCFSMVSDTPDVVEVILGSDGFAAGAKRGNVIVDMSTISPDTTRDIAKKLSQRGIDMLDAPVSGGEQGAIDGTLSIMVGGKESIYRRVLPIFQIVGRSIVHIGGHGDGQVAKACNQLLIAQTIMATAEAIEFAKQAGADAGRVRRALLGGFAHSKILEVHGQRILDDDHRPGFKAGLHCKDLRIACEMADREGLYLEGLQRAYACLKSLVARGDRDLDSSAMAKIVSEKAHPKNCD